jgi:membrane-associated protease RseP (regulator of RpoE activity)
MRHVELVGPGRELAIELWRETTRRRVHVKAKLGKWPLPDRSGMVASKRRHPTWRGLDVDYPTGRRRFVPDSFEFPRAVVVTAVQPGSSAAESGIEPGDFIESAVGQRTETPADFFRVVNSRRGGVSLKLLDGRQVTLTP